jgi:hypothetical protein
VDKGSCLGYDPLWLHRHYACNHKNFVMARRSLMTDDAISVVDKVENWPAGVDFQKADFEIASFQDAAQSLRLQYPNGHA